MCVGESNIRGRTVDRIRPNKVHKPFRFLMSSSEGRSHLITPYGGTLVDLVVPPEELEALKQKAGSLPSLRISERAVCDLELLASGAFSPLDRFMGHADFQRVLEEMRLTSGHIFPIPVTLPVEACDGLALDREIALRNAKNELLAVMTVEEIYEWDRAEVAEKVFRTQDARHPLVAEMRHWGKLNLSGGLRVLQLRRHYDFQELRLTPAQTRERLARLGYRNVIAYQTCNPLHHAHKEMTKRAAQEVNGVLLLQPVVGMTKPGDMDHFTRVRAYERQSERYYERSRILLSLLPLAMRMAGAREVLWQALICRNYGANHLIVGRDDADPGADATGEPFYSPYDAQELREQYGPEIGVKSVPFRRLADLPGEERYEEITKIQAETCQPAYQHGVCIWFTGLSGAGKSTTAELLTVLLMERGRQVTQLDGDVVRTHLSTGLGFEKEDREINIRRIGFVAAEIVRHGGLVICAAVSPYRSSRTDVRYMVTKGHFVEVFVDTPLEVCEARDAKGMYAKARRGEIKNFTGIDDAYEVPLRPELILDTVNKTPEENARLILDYLINKGLVRAAVKSDPGASVVVAIKPAGVAT
jgi:sulfate adenylyltransferase